MKVEMNVQRFEEILTNEYFIQAEEFDHDKVRSCVVLQKRGPKGATILSSPNSPPVFHFEKDEPVIPVEL